MYEQIKDILLYLYQATDKIEEKAVLLSEQRKERMEDFKKNREELEEKAKTRLGEMKVETKEKAQKQVNEILKQAGVARKEEIDELKKMVADLTKKVEKLTK